MKPRIETLTEKKLVGKRSRMSLLENRTRELWQSLMPRRKEIRNAVNPYFYSLEVYDADYFKAFNPSKEFEKWAAIEVSDFDAVPDGMETLLVPAGLYAVFIHKGPASNSIQTYRFIFETWLPSSDYVVDTRPHFAVMGEKYKADDANSEEEIWIPIRSKETS